MTEHKTIAVVGATGSQGGGLVRAILDAPDSGFTARVLTRDAESPRALALAGRGAEVVEADLDDEASVHRGFAGAYGAFVVTNFWAPLTPEQEAARDRARMEIDQAHIAARAAHANGLRHVVWSTLEDTRPYFAHLGRTVPTPLGTYAVPHFDAKAEANAAFTSLGVPTTFLQTTFFYEAFTQGQGPHRDADGKLVLSLPMADRPLAMIAAEDIGRTALGVLSRGVEYVGRTVSIAGEHATGEELAARFTALLGEQVTYRPQSYEQARAAGYPSAVEVGNMYEFYAEAAAYFTGARDLDLVRRLNPRLESLDGWLARHRAEIGATV
ncbi:NmrA/HSCARG family protein [Streptomyces lasiicapitis]|uniref:Nucleotide-diphosphate-sugar epimerase n=1 Tax=Streptomyces lasiicapitis TaxID=1923961 RepID=A0ABQ2MVE7_9ACTN|nr:NmrA/HSCARG family protein [Streptomyces lasiicapitis]GGO58611.1 nucleotide-diphosphate-sugar epimerase [Streptomyces lasiicapitis]